MAKPAPRFAGRTYLITRRVEGRRFLLRPDEVLTQLFVWLLAVLTTRYDISVYAAVCMSTHFHLVVHVPHIFVSDFMHDLDMHFAKAIQVLRRYAHGVVWEPGKLSVVELVTEEAILEKIAYCIANPVAASLVAEPEQWPGLVTTVEELGVHTYIATRPSFYFTGTTWPAADEEVSFDVVLPEFLRQGGMEAGQARVRVEVEAQLAEARRERKQRGWRVMGAVAARNVSPYQYAKSWQSLHQLDPHFAAGRGQTEQRSAALRSYKQFLSEHAAAKQRWMAGECDVVFPAGTFWMVVHHGARVAVPPD